MRNQILQNNHSKHFCYLLIFLILTYAYDANGNITSITPQSSQSRNVECSDSDNLLSLTSATDTITLNGKTYTSSYDASLKKYTLTITQGAEGIGQRVYTINYDSLNQISNIINPVAQSINFTYDLAGRVTQQILPDSRVINYSYDANGNVTSITPPSRPAHTFTYTGVDLEDSYTPPALTPPLAGGVGGGVTTYSYNLDKQLTLITRPDAQTISLNYDTGGRLNNITTPTSQINYAYSSIGNLSTITAPSETISFTYDDSLLKSSTWTGTIAGNVSFTYNSDFRVTAGTINEANSVSFTYDNDGKTGKNWGHFPD